MKSTIYPSEVGEKVARTYFLDSTEEFITATQAVHLLATRPPSKEKNPNFVTYTMPGHTAGDQEALEATCAILATDLSSGLMRFNRGYGGMYFNPEDSEVIDAAMEMLASLSPVSTEEADQSYLGFVPVARYLLNNVEIDYAGKDFETAMGAMVAKETISVVN